VRHTHIRKDFKIISKIFEFLAKGHDIERSGTFLEIKDANGRAFRYASMKDCPSESKRWGNGNVEVMRIDEAFRNMVEYTVARLEQVFMHTSRTTRTAKRKRKRKKKRNAATKKTKRAPLQEIRSPAKASAREEALQLWSSARWTKLRAAKR
jgi:hypothetical protein